MKKKLLYAAAVVAAVMSSSVQASEIDMLVDKLAEKGLITYGEAQTIKTESIEDARKRLAKGEVSTLPQWIQNISVKGDLRLRHQMDWASNVNYARTRERLRLRLGFETRPADNIKAGFGLATGSEKVSGTSVLDAEATSTNHTFSGFTKALLMVDYAYLEYMPLSSLKVTAGKMKAGTQIWNPTDLLWDTDINPDGVALAYSMNVLSNVSAGVNSSWLILNDIKTAGKSNPDVTIIQPYALYKPTEKLSIKAAYNVQNFNVNAKDTVICGTPTFDYNTTGLSAEVKYLEILGSYTASLMADLAANTDSKPTSDKSASAIGLKFGDEKVVSFGQWQLTYLNRELQTNAWLPMGDSDAYGGATNSTGYEVIAAVGLTPSLSLGIDFYAMELKTVAANASKVPKSLAQVDLVYKF